MDSDDSERQIHYQLPSPESAAADFCHMYETHLVILATIGHSEPLYSMFHHFSAHKSIDIDLYWYVLACNQLYHLFFHTFFSPHFFTTETISGSWIRQVPGIVGKGHPLAMMQLASLMEAEAQGCQGPPVG